MSADGIDPRDFGRLEAEVASLKKTVDQMAADMRAIRTTLDAAGGGWRVLVAVGAASGAVTALLVKLLPFLPMR